MLKCQVNLILHQLLIDITSSPVRQSNMSRYIDVAPGSLSVPSADGN